MSFIIPNNVKVFDYSIFNYDQNPVDCVRRRVNCVGSTLLDPCSCDVSILHAEDALLVSCGATRISNCIDLIRVANQILQYINVTKKNEHRESACQQHCPCDPKHYYRFNAKMLGMLLIGQEYHTNVGMNTLDDGTVGEFVKTFKILIEAANNMIVKSLKNILPVLPELVLKGIVSFMKIEDIKFVGEFQDQDEDHEEILANSAEDIELIHWYFMTLLYDMRTYASVNEPSVIAQANSAISDCPQLLFDVGRSAKIITGEIVLTPIII